MTDGSRPGSEEEFSPGLADVLEAVLQSLENGLPVDVERLKSQYPDLEPQIDQCVGNLLFIEGASHAIDCSTLSADHNDILVPLGTIGDFQLLRQLGRGGMGVVFEAEQLSLKRRVALKILPFAALIDESAIRRFRQEVNAAASLHHPHIVDVYSVGCDKGVHHYAMRLIRGQSLVRTIEQISQLEEAERWRFGLTLFGDGLKERDGTKSNQTKPLDYYRAVARIGISIAEALNYSHEHGVIHRDVKPSNIIVDEHGKAWITDFGLAQVDNGTKLTMTGDMLGTLRYMSPEQANGDLALDKRTDIYSLGVTIYELLTFRTAFDADDRSPLFKQVVLSEPTPLRKLDCQIPSDLESIILKAMERSPADRYQSGRQLADDMQRFLDGLPTVARPPSAGRRISKWARRNAALTVSLVATMMVVACASLIFYERNTRQQEQKVRKSHETVIASMTLVEQNHKYVNEIQLAFHCWNENRIHAMRHSLNNCLPSDDQSDLRDFAWYYLQALVDSIPAPIGKHETESYFVEFARDDVHAVSAGDDGIRVWNTDTHQQTHYLTKSPTQWIDFSADGSMMATATTKQVLLWDTNSWKVIRAFDCEQVALGAEFVANNKVVMAEREEGPGSLHSMISLVDLATGEVVWKKFVQNNKAESICVSAATGNLAVAYSAGEVCVMNLVDGSVVHSVQIPNGAAAIAASSDGRYFAAGSGVGLVSLFSFDAPFEKLAEIPASKGGVSSLHFSFNDTFLIVASGDGTTTQLRTILDDSPARILLARRFRYTDPLWCARYDNRSRKLVTAERSGSISVRDTWLKNDIQNGMELNGRNAESFSTSEKFIFAGGSSHFDCSSDGQFIVQHDFDQNLQIVDSQTGETIFTTTVDAIRLAGAEIAAGAKIGRCRFIPQSRTIAVDIEGDVIFVDSAGKVATWDKLLPGRQNSFRFSPTGENGRNNRRPL